MRPRVDLWVARADQTQAMSRKSRPINLLPGYLYQPIPGSCVSGYIVFKRVAGAVAWPGPELALDSPLISHTSSRTIRNAVYSVIQFSEGYIRRLARWKMNVQSDPSTIVVTVYF
jgi:hypothetical protein